MCAKRFTRAAALVLVAMAAVSSGEVQDPLWDKAVETATVNRNWMPGLVKVSEVVRNKRGELIETTATSFRLFLSDGEVDAELVSASENGADITEAARREFQKNKAAWLADGLEESPFDPNAQDRVSATATGKTAVVDETECTVYVFTHVDETGLWRGEAWLDPTLGAPLRIFEQLESVPLQTDDAEMLELDIAVHDDVTPDKKWLARRIVSKGRFKTGWLFETEGTFVEETLLENHWEYEP
jgi:hypothetical protein